MQRQLNAETCLQSSLFRHNSDFGVAFPGVVQYPKTPNLTMVNINFAISFAKPSKKILKINRWCVRGLGDCSCK